VVINKLVTDGQPAACKRPAAFAVAGKFELTADGRTPSLLSIGSAEITPSGLRSIEPMSFPALSPPLSTMNMKQP
jgi:hypothetical protein